MHPLKEISLVLIAVSTRSQVGMVACTPYVAYSSPPPCCETSSLTSAVATNEFALEVLFCGDDDVTIRNTVSRQDEWTILSSA